MISLCVYIDDQREAFSVTISPDDAIHVLKDRIKDMWSNLLLGYDATALNLTKVDEDLKEVTNKINNIGHYWPDSEDQRVLQFTEKIREVWPSLPPRDRLHVFVGLPDAVDQPSQKRQRLSDAGDLEAPPPPWLKEFHSKMWNKKDLKEELFRTVEVTRAHYNKLQRRLNDRNPDRDSPEYDATEHDVLSDKLDFLRLIAEDGALPPLHPDNNEVQVGDDGDPEARNEDEDLEASDEDDSEINSFFPFTLSYLDFSTLKLKASLERFHPALLLHQEYNHISKLINKGPKNGAGSVILSGQPGTGKTVYLYLRIIECLIEGCPFLYQTKEGTVYHVSQNGVEAIRVWSSKNPETHIVAFVDGDEEDCAPQSFLFRSSVQIIFASFPRGADQRWARQAETNYKIIFTELATDLWSPRELFLTGIFLYPYDISVRLLKESTSYFGYNPRRCFNASRSMAILESKKADVMGQITGTATGTANILRVLHSARNGDSDASHSIFQLSPGDESRFLSKCHIDAVSPWVLDELLKRSEIIKADAAAALCRSISGTFGAATLWGHLFERQVLRYLDDIKTHQALTMRRLADSESVTWTYRGPIPRFTFQEPAVIAKIKNAVETKKPLHLVPSAPNFPAVNSIIYHPDDDVLTCIQITMNSDHPITVRGLRRIQSWLKPNTLPENLSAEDTRKWRFIFIVPFDKASTFTSQKFEDKKGNTDNREWAGKVDQLVFGVNV